MDDFHMNCYSFEFCEVTQLKKYSNNADSLSKTTARKNRVSCNNCWTGRCHHDASSCFVVMTSIAFAIEQRGNAMKNCVHKLQTCMRLQRGCISSCACTNVCSCIYMHMYAHVCTIGILCCRSITDMLMHRTKRNIKREAAGWTLYFSLSTMH